MISVYLRGCKLASTEPVPAFFVGHRVVFFFLRTVVNTFLTHQSLVV